jgi:hypothetical protein
MNLSPENILAGIGTAIGFLVYGFVRWQHQDEWKESWTPIVWVIGFGPATLFMFLGSFGSIGSFLGGIGGGILLANWLAPKIIQRIILRQEKAARRAVEEQALVNAADQEPKTDTRTGRRSLKR